MGWEKLLFWANSGACKNLSTLLSPSRPQQLCCFQLVITALQTVT